MNRVVCMFTVLIACLVAPLLVRAQPVAPPDGASQPDSIERFQPGRIRWQPCPENADLECGTLRLPVDYRNLGGESFDMAVIRAKATNPGRRVGVAFANPGGPGGSGVNLVLGGIAARAPIVERLRERFDLISFDPRGAHRSRPVRCRFDPGEPPAGADDAALAAYWDGVSRAYVQACRQQNGPFVFTLSASNIALDMDMLRRALGERQISYIGISFGSQLGAVYASLFPQRLRATLLDAGVAPELRDGLVEFWSEYAYAFEFAFQHLDQLCRRDAACPLQERGVAATFDAVVAKLKAAPVTSPDGVELTADDVTDIVGTLLYGERGHPLIVQALAEASAGNYATLFALMPTTSSGNTALVPIICNTYGTRRPAADLLPFDEAFNGANPRFFGRFTLLSTVGLCAAWPAAEQTAIRNVRREVATPIVLIGNEFDNATPISWTRSLAYALGMERSVVRYGGGGHAVTTNGNPCTDDIIVAYLVDRRVPAEGTVCPALPLRFAPASAAARTQALESTDAGWEPAPAPWPRLR